MFNIFNITDSLFSRLIDVRNRGFDNNKLKVFHSVKPVISIGNLSFGGSGKTPLTITIAEELLNMGKHPAVIGRGYKRLYKDTNVVSTGDKILTGWKSAGDEMYLIASKVPVPVIVSESKSHAAEIAQDFNIDCIIVDDGFQHRRLHRDIDILILDKNTIEKPYLPPRGSLREPVSAAKRANFVFAHEGLEISSIVPKYTDASIVRFITEIENVQSVSDNVEFEGIAPTLALSGIANPKRFYVSLLAKNIDVAKHLKFGDHHVYSRNDVGRIIQIAKSSNVKQIITTEKDALKLIEFSEIFANHSIKIFSLPIKIIITENKETFFSEVIKLIVQKP